jgi:hypothetical protein
MRSTQRQLQTLVRLKAARSIHGGPRNERPTALRSASRQADFTTAAQFFTPRNLYIEAVTS